MKKIFYKFFRSTLHFSQKKYASTKRFIEGIVMSICVADARKHVFPSFDKPEGNEGSIVPVSINSKYFIFIK